MVNEAPGSSWARCWVSPGGGVTQQEDGAGGRTQGKILPSPCTFQGDRLQQMGQ